MLQLTTDRETNDLKSYSVAFDTLDSGGFGPTQFIKFLWNTLTSHVVVMGAALPATNVWVSDCLCHEEFCPFFCMNKTGRR